MTPKNLADEIENRSLKAIERLNKIVISAQDQAYGRVVVVLQKLKLDKDGYILQTADNRKLLRDANKTFTKALESSGYLEGLNKFTVTFSVIDDLNEEYFTSFDGFNPKRQFIRSLQKQAIADIESTMLNQGLEAQIKIPLQQMLNQNINSGGSFTGMLEQVKSYIKGTPDIDGKLLRYVKQISKDALFNYSRTYQQSIASDLGLEFFLYAGTIIDKTRDFCESKAGNYFHLKEIEEWADQSWAGKREGTTKNSIFIYAGGHNCLHQILPVSIILVPEEVIERATKAGFYKSKTPALQEQD